MPTAANGRPVQRWNGVRAISTKTKGIARAMCKGRLTRFGTRPVKTSQRRKPMDSAPSAAQKSRAESDMNAVLVNCRHRAGTKSCKEKGPDMCPGRNRVGLEDGRHCRRLRTLADERLLLRVGQGNALFR